MNKKAIVLMLSAFLFSEMAYSAVKPSGSRFDTRNQNINYNSADTTVINVATGYVTTLVFDDEEKVVDTQVGFEQGWNIQAAENRVYIKIRPVTQSVEVPDENGNTVTKNMAFDPEDDLGRWKTNLFIVTTKRIYSNELNAVTFQNPDKISFVVNYRYPAEDRKIKTEAENQRIAELQRKNEITAINNSFKNAKAPKNWRYYGRVAKGSESITPAYAYDDGRFTYFGFSPVQRIPSFFVQYGNTETLTNPVTEKRGNYTVVIIPQLNDKWVIRYGDQVVGVENQGFGKIRLNDTDTVSPDVKREVIQ